MPDPSGSPKPAQAAEGAVRLIRALGIGAIVIGGLYLAATATTTSTIGATRSAKLEWQNRQGQIDQAIQQDAADRADQRQVSP
jgi:hypothetical protein